MSSQASLRRKMEMISKTTKTMAEKTTQVPSPSQIMESATLMRMTIIGDPANATPVKNAEAIGSAIKTTGARVTTIVVTTKRRMAMRTVTVTTSATLMRMTIIGDPANATPATNAEVIGSAIQTTGARVTTIVVTTKRRGKKTTIMMTTCATSMRMTIIGDPENATPATNAEAIGSAIRTTGARVTTTVVTTKRREKKTSATSMRMTIIGDLANATPATNAEAIGSAIRTTGAKAIQTATSETA